MMLEDQNSRLAHYAAFITGQLEGLCADHQAHLQYPGIRRSLPQDEIQRGKREAQRWLAEVEARRAQDLPEYLAERGSAARTARLYGRH